MFRIVNPCTRRWQDLPGDDRRRFCAECGLTVHAIESYSPDEQRALMAAGERVCASLHAPKPSRRVLFLASMATAVRPLWAATGSLRVVVRDATGAPIVGAGVQVFEKTRLVAKAVTDQQGAASVDRLPLSIDLEICSDAMGFATLRTPVRLTVAVTSVGQTLAVGSVGGGVFVEPQPVPLATIPSKPAAVPPRKRRWFR